MADRKDGLETGKENPARIAASSGIQGMCMWQHDSTCIQQDGKAAVSDWQANGWETSW